MQEELVTFQVAKLAKEKGFNWKVRYSYGHKINPHIAYPKEDYSIPNDFNSPNTGRNWSHLYSAPTQSLLQKWLRKVHGIHIAILPKILPSNEIVYYLFKGKLKRDFNDLHNTYEEALEIGLQEALKLIKDETNTNRKIFTSYR